ncbi:vascular endothelial growth factor A isoform X4 [Alligator sinensis]|uniref:Vascular endothelial growth factor A isoform X4 n=1 Tax=Alligator sinensis TaxID=38654 RepID=A0A3Q0G5A7_ALLSI|nr:vascular endothelial growth factor A isoform X4 [Alligator sinensis]
MPLARLDTGMREPGGPGQKGGLKMLSQAAPTLGDGERKPNEVIKFLDVYERSYCRTIETLVDIFQEYPDEVEYIFKPSCVPLMRCAGCCGDEGLECVPGEVHNVTMEIMRIKPHQSQHIAYMSFLQHSKCECRPKKDVKAKQEKKSKRGKGKGQKRKRKKVTVSLAQRGESTCLYKIPRPVNVPAKTQIHVANRGSLS